MTEALPHPFDVPDVHAGMMVTPSVKLVRPLGEGGMGAVWVAEHLALRTQVVVKFIAAGLKDNKEATERFSREAAAAAQVKSPHVVQTFDHGITEGGTPYIVMELLEGRDLGELLDSEGRCSPELVLSIVAQLARALDRAHERGIVHRDIKPGNIFLCDGGRGDVFVKLLDFGIAKGVEMPGIDSTTKTGAMVGSPFYMSPEQILGSKAIDHRTDVWSLGVVAYEALTGRKPFDAETMGGLAIRIHSEPLPLPSKTNPSLPAAVDAWFQRACARSADERFASASELAAALAAALGGEMPRSADLPRISTGASRDPANEPVFAAGATTEAGVVAPAAPASARNRVVAILAFGAVLCLATFGVVTALRPRPSPTPPPSTNAVTPPPTASAKVEEPPASLPPPPAPADPAPPASTPSPAVPGKPKPRPTPPPAAPSPPTRPPLPSPAPAPPPSGQPPGRDIF